MTDLNAATPSQSDRMLLDRFVSDRDEAAFAILVQRYHGLVMGVCRRVLGNANDAEDAYQATFMVMARRASSLTWYEVVAGWLHETAYRTAKSQSRKQANQSNAVRLSGTFQEDAQAKELAPDHAAMLHELNRVLDEEIAQLPTKYRDPLLLQLFEGLERKDMAERLGTTTGAVKDRLEKARELLRAKLKLRGFTLSLGTFAAWLTTESASQAASVTLTQTTTQAATAFAAGSSTAGIVSLSTTSLAQGMVQMYFFGKAKLYVASAILAMIVGITAYGLIHDSGDRFEKRIRGYVQSVDGDASPPRLTILLDEFEVPLSLDVSKTVVVHQAYEAISLKRLKAGTYVGVKLGKDHRTIEEIHSLGKLLQAEIVGLSIDAKSPYSTLKVRSVDDDNDVRPQEQVLKLASGVILRIGGLPASIRHVRPGMQGRFEFGPSGDLIHCIELDAAEGHVLEATLISIDAVNRKLIASIDQDDVLVEKEFALTPDAIIQIGEQACELSSIAPSIAFRARLSYVKPSAIEMIRFAAQEREEEGDEEREGASNDEHVEDPSVDDDEMHKTQEAEDRGGDRDDRTRKDR